MSCPGAIVQNIITNNLSWDEIYYWSTFSKGRDAYNIAFWKLLHTPWEAQINNSNKILVKNEIENRMPVAAILENGGDEQTFTLKRGQPWYRVTFFVPDLKPVRLVKMEERPEFLKRTKNKTDLTIFKDLNWRKIFTDFGNSRPKKLIP